MYKAGVDFSGCLRNGVQCECAFCGSKQRWACEELAEKDKRYSDDPRNDKVDKELNGE